MSEKENAETDTHEEITERLLNEIIYYLDNISVKLDTIQILLFIIALPVIIGIILALLLFIGALRIF